MIFYLEIAMTLIGLFFLITGRTFGKNDFAHPHLRLLGVFLITVFPAAFGAILILGVVWGLTHPNQTVQEAQDSLLWPAMGVEAAVAITYFLVALLWEKSIKRKAEASTAE